MIDSTGADVQQIPFHRGIMAITSLTIILKVRRVAICLDISLAFAGKTAIGEGKWGREIVLTRAGKNSNYWSMAELQFY